MSIKQPWNEHWEVTEDLTRGGQGTTKVVRRKSDKHMGILKILNNQKSTQARIRMYQEVANLKVLHSLKCRVPEVLDSNTDAYEDSDVRLFFVMERIEGETLTEFVRKEDGLSVEESVSITTMICETMQKGIAEGIYHRDLKPDNIMVKPSDDHEIVVIDYGLSFNTNEAIDATRTGEKLDNEFLSLPERRAPGGNRRDPRSDITGMAAVLYYCLSAKYPVELSDENGKPPHRREGYSISKRITDESLLQSIETLLDRAFSPLLEDRFQSCEELVQRMKAILAGTNDTPAPDPVAYAEQLGKRLLARDRKTQIATFRSNSEEIIQKLNERTNMISQGMSMHGFQLSSMTLPSNWPCPGPGDEILRYALNVANKNNNSSSGIAYVVISRGKECIVFRQLLKEPLQNRACDIQP